MRLLTFLLLISTAAKLPGQQQLFTGASFEHEVTQRYGYVLEVEHRQIVNTGRENRVLLLGALNFLLSDWLSVTPGVRVTPDYGEGPTEYRLFTDLNTAVGLGDGPFTLEGRIRSQYERLITSEPFTPEVAVRPRIGLSYELTDHTGFVIEYEARYRFDQRNEFARHRYTLGISQELSTRVSIEAFYRLERDTNVADAVTEPTIGLFLEYILPDARDRDWRYRRPFGRSVLW
jgi:hypothetical protein